MNEIFPGFFLQKLKKKAANKIHLSHLNASMAKNEMTYTPKLNAAKKYYIVYIFHYVRPMCQQHKKQLGQG